MSIVSTLKKNGGKATAQTISDAMPDLTKELPTPNAKAMTGKIFGIVYNAETEKYEFVDITERLTPEENDPNI